MKHYHKLVRDLIPDIIAKSGKTCKTDIVNNDIAFQLLVEKLDEEVSEFKADLNLEELADVLEVLIALAQKMNYTEADLFNKRNEKKATRGGFEKNIVLYEVSE